MIPAIDLSGSVAMGHEQTDTTGTADCGRRLEMARVQTRDRLNVGIGGAPCATRKACQTDRFRWASAMLSRRGSGLALAVH